MQKMATALILIILGLIVIAFTLLGLVPVAVLSGFLVLMLGIGFILTGISKIGENDAALGIFMLILGIIALILGIGFIFNPGLFTWIVGFIIWIIGLFLIIEGIARILSKTGGNKCGVKDIIIGIIIIFVGLFLASYTWLLGLLIGLWLLTTGIRMLYIERLRLNHSSKS
jgi:membrane protein HdeD